MTQNNQPTFQPGKFYKTRDGRKARIYATDAGTPWTIHGALLHLSQWINAVWQDQGKYLLTGDNSADLIAEWKDAPSVDWSKMPAWANAVAMDKDDVWWWFESKPELAAHVWKNAEFSQLCDVIPNAYCPKWSGDWRESLVTRSTEETK